MLMLEKVFQILNDSGLDYCVQNKYEMMPENIPSDIDIMYKNADEKFFDRLMAQIANATELLITQKVVHDYLQYTYVFTPAAPKAEFRLQLDFYRALSFRKYKNVLPGEQMLNTKRRYNCFFIPAPDIEVVYQIMRRVIKEDMTSEHLNVIRKLYINFKEQVVITIRKNFFVDVANKIIEMLESDDVEIFYENLDEFRNNLLEISKKNTGLVYYRDTILFTMSKVVPQRIIHPVGLSVAFVAPDGAGKSTVISGVENTCSGSFYGISKYYFRPHLLKNIGSYNVANPHGEGDSNPDPHKVKVDGKIKSLIRFFYYQIDFVLGWNLKVRKNLIQKKLVLFDRYYFDYYADMLRYRYSLPSSFAIGMSWMIPKPDLVVALDGNAKVFYMRKQELTVDEINHQLVAFKKIKDHCKTVEYIKADQSIDEVLNSVTAVILCKKAEKTLERMKLNSNDRSILKRNIQRAREDNNAKM